MNKLNVIPLANTLAVIDLLLHLLFHFWVAISPRTYESAMNLFIAGFHPQVTAFDISFSHIVVGTLVETSAFWLLGASMAILYNKFSSHTV